jgi:hypothetical protein
VISALPTAQSRTELLGLEQGIERWHWAVTIPENVDAIHSMILGDRRISAKKIAGTLAISQERVDCIVHEVFVHEKALSQMRSQMPQCWSEAWSSACASQAILDWFWQDHAGFCNHLLTMDETWIHLYDPEAKEQSKEWRYSGFPCPKSSRYGHHQARCKESVFWDKDGILQPSWQSTTLHLSINWSSN